MSISGKLREILAEDISSEDRPETTVRDLDIGDLTILFMPGSAVDPSAYMPLQLRAGDHQHDPPRYYGAIAAFGAAIGGISRWAAILRSHHSRRGNAVQE